MTLHDHQRRGARAAVAAIEEFGGALLCDPVGAGKTRTALVAAARVADGRPIVVVAPPATRDGWEHEARRVDIPMKFISLGRLSRGSRRPVEGRAVWIVDEAHHLRHPGIRRSRCIEEWVGTDPVLLVTATPVVNGASDVEHLVSLFASHAATRRVDAWQRIVVRAATPVTPGRLRRVRVGPAPDPMTAEALDAAALAASLGVESAAGLLRAQLWRRWASSPEACAATLRRVERYLGECARAAAVGRALPRGTLAGCLDGPIQTMFAFVLPEDPDVPTVAEVSSARAVVAAARARVTTQRWCAEHLGAFGDAFDGTIPTLAFSECVDTARCVGAALERCGRRVLVVTGSGARGRAFGRVDVDVAFRLFREGHPGLRERPDVLVCTPVGSEGQNLQRARRVIHLDLPWNPARLEQRVGRADRIGSAGTVDELVLLPARAVCERVDPWAHIGRKARWVERWEQGELWRWAERVPRETAWPPTARVLDQLMSWARSLERAGRSADARRLLVEVVPVWVEGPGRARRRAWRSVGADVDAACRWARQSMPLPSSGATAPDPLPSEQAAACPPAQARSTSSFA